MLVNNRKNLAWAAALGALINTPALAQTGSGLVLRPWGDSERRYEIDADATLANRGKTDNANARFRLQRYDASGRWRQQTDNKNPLTIGIDTSYLDLGTNDPTLPKRLADQSIAAGFRLDEPGGFDAMWLVLGVGYAGNTPYADGDAVYAQASLVYTMPVDEQTSWQFTLDYNGNRSILPDIPIPTVAYQKQVNAEWSYIIGLPINAIHWKPNDRLSIRVMYFVPRHHQPRGRV